MRVIAIQSQPLHAEKAVKKMQHLPTHTNTHLELELQVCGFTFISRNDRVQVFHIVLKLVECHLSVSTQQGFSNCLVHEEILIL